MTAVAGLRWFQEQRTALGIQLQATALQAVYLTVRATPACRLLVFGVGNDTPFWLEANRTGETVFVEDDLEWAARVPRGVEVFCVRYGTRVSRWRAELEQARAGTLTLLPILEQDRRQFDVILVDGPAGYRQALPGRVASIALARRLATRRTSVFLDDCDRELEATTARALFTRSKPVTKRFWRLYA